MVNGTVQTEIIQVCPSFVEVEIFVKCRMHETPFIDQIVVELIKQEVTYYVVRSTCLFILVAIKNKYYSISMCMLL